MKLLFICIVSLILISVVISVEETFDTFHEGKQTNRLSTYSPEKLEKLLLKMDVNKDSEINKEELMNWLVDLSTIQLNKRTRDDVYYYDKDKDNKVTWTEMLASSYGYTEEMANEFLKSSNPDDKEMYEYMMDERARFRAADLDGDGFLSHSEYKSILNPSENPTILNILISKIMLKYDENKDAHLNETEFKLYFYITLDLTEDQAKEFELIMRKYDFNHDGMMSVKELETWLYPGIKEAADVESNYLISISDTDNNKVLTFDEIKTAVSHWKVSQATNYGEHIKDEL